MSEFCSLALSYSLAWLQVYCKSFLRAESHPFIPQNFAQMSEPHKTVTCSIFAHFWYHSIIIFIAPVRLIIIMLSITHRQDFMAQIEFFVRVQWNSVKSVCICLPWERQKLVQLISVCSLAKVASRNWKPTTQNWISTILRLVGYR